MPEVQAMEKAEAERWNRDGRLAAWLTAWIPAFVSHGVFLGIASAFSERNDLPDLPDWDTLLRSLPDYEEEPK